VEDDQALIPSVACCDEKRVLLQVLVRVLDWVHAQVLCVFETRLEAVSMKQLQALREQMYLLIIPKN
jgi:hypothetical protein